MSEPREPWLAWPGGKHLRFAAMLAVIGFAWFRLIFRSADAITASRETHWHVHLPAELALPLVPDAIVVYLSIELLFAIAPFVLRQRRPLVAFAVAANTATLIAGILFVLLPVKLAFPPPADLGHFPKLFRLADEMNLTYNLVPSLHVTFSVLGIGALSFRCDAAGKAVLWCWAAAIAASTVLTHQHHVVDVAAGAALGWLMFRTVFLPRATLRPVSSAAGA